MEYFPFGNTLKFYSYCLLANIYLDEQTCELRFGSTGFSATQVRFGWYATENSMELSDYLNSSTWYLSSAPAKIRIIHSPEPPYESRTEVVFFMSKIHFSSSFYHKNLFFKISDVNIYSIQSI